MRTTPEKLDSVLRNLAPVFLLSGAEPLRSNEAADAIRAAARAAGYTERDVFFIERANAGPWDEIYAAAQAMSLFAARRLLEIRIPGGKPGVQGAAALQELTASLGNDVLLLVITGELDWSAQKAVWVSALEQAGVWVEAAPIPPAQLPGWLVARAAREGLTLDAEAVQALAQHCEGNLLAAAQELTKLALAGHRQVGAAEVLAGSAQSSRFDVAQLGEAVLRGDTPRALRVLAGLRAEDVEPTLALWSVWQELRALWQVLLPGAPITGVWSRNKALLPGAAARLKPLGRAFFAQLEARMARVDRIVKGRQWGNGWDELALLVAEFAGGRAVLPATAERG